MARTTRGKLKENLEGIHRNCEWIKLHCEKSLELLPDDYPQFVNNFNVLVKIVDQLDEFANEIYSHV